MLSQERSLQGYPCDPRLHWIELNTKTQGPTKVDKQFFSIFSTPVCLIIDTRVSCNDDMRCSKYLSSLYSIHQPTLLFTTAREHNEALSLSCFLQITLKQCFRRSSGLNGFSLPFYSFLLKANFAAIVYSPNLQACRTNKIAFWPSSGEMH